MKFEDLINRLKRQSETLDEKVSNTVVADMIEMRLKEGTNSDRNYYFLMGVALGMRTNVTISNAEQGELWDDLMDRSYPGWRERIQNADGERNNRKTV